MTIFYLSDQLTKANPAAPSEAGLPPPAPATIAALPARFSTDAPSLLISF